MIGPFQAHKTHDTDADNVLLQVKLLRAIEVRFMMFGLSSGNGTLESVVSHAGSPPAAL